MGSPLSPTLILASGQAGDLGGPLAQEERQSAFPHNEDKFQLLPRTRGLYVPVTDDVGFGVGKDRDRHCGHTDTQSSNDL